MFGRLVQKDDLGVQGDERQPPQFGLELALAFGVGEPGDPFGRGRELHAVAGEAAADRDRDREMRFASPGWSEQDHVLAGSRKSSYPRCSMTVFLTER